MADRKKRSQQTYVSRKNAVHITLYSPNGESVPAEVKDQFAQLATNLALENRLLVGIATT